MTMKYDAESQKTWSTVIVIGAPRSGTNMLRDILTSLPGVATWPCDEINYIWRHGNVRFPSDELPPDLARESVRHYIQGQFDWVAKQYNASTVVEKTCANSLRVPFVDQILPNAKYIFIFRDGLDAVGSAMKRWKATLDIPYLAQKARFVPITDLPYYSLHYIWNLAYRLLSHEDRLAFWGPQLQNMQELLNQYSLEEVCAIQWRTCVELSNKAFRAIPKDRVCRVKYEAFVQCPEIEMQRIVKFIGLDNIETKNVTKAVKSVSATSVGKGRSELGSDAITKLTPLVENTLRQFGYI